MIKQLKVDGYVFEFYGFKNGIAYHIDGKNQFPYYFNNMRDAINFAYEYGEIKRSIGM